MWTVVTTLWITATPKDLSELPLKYKATKALYTITIIVLVLRNDSSFCLSIYIKKYIANQR